MNWHEQKSMGLAGRMDSRLTPKGAPVLEEDI